MSRAAEKRTRLRSRTRDLAERRPSLVRLLIALFVARLVVTVVELTESRLTWWALLITAAIGLEAWRAWSVSRVATAEHLKAAPLPDSRWARFLRPLERSGPAVLYSLTAIFAAATVVLVILGSSHDTLLDVAIIGREITTLFPRRDDRRLLLGAQHRAVISPAAPWGGCSSTRLMHMGRSTVTERCTTRPLSAIPDME